MYETNRLLWPVNFIDTASSSFLQCLAILELDTSYKHKTLHRISSFTDKSQGALDIVRIGSNYFTGRRVIQSSSSSIIYKLDLQFNKLDSISFNCAIEDLQTDGHELTLKATLQSAPCKYTAQAQMLMLDTSFSVTMCKSFDSLKVVKYGDINNTLQVSSTRYSKLRRLSKHKVLLLSNQSISDQLFKPSTDGLLYTIYDQATDSLLTIVHYSSSVNIAFNDWTSYCEVKEGKILTVACVGYDWSQFPRLQSQSTKMLVTVMDTTGSILFQKEHGDGYYYFPRSIKFTANNEIVIAGLRSDPVNKPKYMESFLLKLDAEGDLNHVSLSEERPEPTVTFYPNPVSTVLRTRSKKGSVEEFLIFNLLGEQVMQSSTQDSSIDISHLAAGTYIVRTKNADRTYFTKIIKQ